SRGPAALSPRLGLRDCSRIALGHLGVATRARGGPTAQVPFLATSLGVGRRRRHETHPACILLCDSRRACRTLSWRLREQHSGSVADRLTAQPESAVW